MLRGVNGEVFFRPFRVALLAAAILLVMVPGLLMWADYAQAQTTDTTSPADTYPPTSDCKSGVTYCLYPGQQVETSVSGITQAGVCTVKWDINWGDGSTETVTTTEDQSGWIKTLYHTYSAVGSYTITIKGTPIPPSPDFCYNIPGGWDYPDEQVQVVPRNPVLNVSASRERVCPNEEVTFTARNKSGSIVDANWSGGGTPKTATTKQFATRFDTYGDKTVTAKKSTAKGTKTIKVMRPSGVWWTGQYPTSTSTSDLTPAFRTDVDNFLSALHNAGASVSISATYRPPERAYLMHYAWDIAHGNIAPGQVPSMKGVDICWLHRNSSGKPDKQASINAAKQMVSAYHIKYRPALKSRHTERRAIDMSISWRGTLKIDNASGDLVKITSTPRTGAGNHDLWRVGKGYGVIKLPSDPPHWSDDGH